MVAIALSAPLLSSRVLTDPGDDLSPLPPPSELLGWTEATAKDIFSNHGQNIFIFSRDIPVALSS